MANEGGTTLRIDAETAAYIAKLSALAESHEKVTKHVDGWGKASEHVLSKITAMAGPLVLVEELTRKAGEAFAEWNEDIKKAGESTDLLVNKLRMATVKTGENRQQVAAEITAAKGPMSYEQAVGFYSQFRGSAPDSAKNITAGRVAGAGAQAMTAGYDLNEFATISGNLYGSAGGKSFDVAAMLEGQLGGGAQDASELIKRTSAQLGSMGPGAMNELMPFLIASAKAKDRKFSFVRGATENLRPGQNVTQALTAARYRGGPLAESIFQNLPAAQQAFAGSGGALASAATNATAGDEEVTKSLETSTTKSQAETANRESLGGRAEEQAYAEANRELYRQKNRLGAFFASMSPTTTIGAYGRGSEIDTFLHGTAAGPVQRAPGSNDTDDTYIPAGFSQMKSAAELLEEQNAILRQKQLRVGAHDE